MAIDSVVAHVELPAVEPLAVRIAIIADDVREIWTFRVKWRGGESPLAILHQNSSRVGLPGEEAAVTISP
jgi:hypothetical protein